jgi:F-type H+-transporting ATPase subunit delta
MAAAAEREAHLAADVGALRIAHIYAQALLGAADTQGQADAIGEELDSLVEDVFAAEERIEALLASPAVPRQTKAELIGRALAPQSGPIFANFLNVLNDHGRLDLLRAIRAAYHELLDERARRVRVQVRSAVALADEQRRRLEGELRDVFRLEPVLEERVEPALLGGMTVKVGDWLYDASLRTRLHNLRNKIQARATHEIQSGRDRFSSDS